MYVLSNLFARWCVYWEQNFCVIREHQSSKNIIHQQLLRNEASFMGTRFARAASLIYSWPWSASEKRTETISPLCLFSRSSIMRASLVREYGLTKCPFPFNCSSMNRFTGSLLKTFNLISTCSQSTSVTMRTRALSDDYACLYTYLELTMINWEWTKRVSTNKWRDATDVARVRFKPWEILRILPAIFITRTEMLQWMRELKIIATVVTNHWEKKYRIVKHAKRFIVFFFSSLLWIT